MKINKIFKKDKFINNNFINSLVKRVFKNNLGMTMRILKKRITRSYRHSTLEHL